MKIQDYKVLTEKIYKVPGRVQELIPINRISEDGIFELERKPANAEKLYDKAYWFADTNFAVMDESEKNRFLQRYCTLLNSMNVSFKICIMNNNRDMEQVRENVFLRNHDGQYADLVNAINSHIETSLEQGRSGIDQVRIFVVTCKRENVERARDYFRSIEANLMLGFSRLKSALIPMNARERLRSLFAFYHLGEESDFSFDFGEAVQKKLDWKSYIAPSVVKECRNRYGQHDGITLQVNDRYVRALYLPTSANSVNWPNSVNPDIIQKLVSGSFHVIVTLDMAAIPQHETRKMLEDQYLQNSRAIEKQQMARNKAGAWSTDITYDRRREKEEIENGLDICVENDEKLFYTGIYAVLTADSMEELENDVTAFCAAASGENMTFHPGRWEQIDMVNTALPLGVRFCNQMYPLFAQPLAGITPFIVHELYHPGGLFYGVNQVSKNMLVGDRKKLRNGNGFVFGKTGFGKGYALKMEICQVFLGTKDDIIIIDPQNEYKVIAEYFGGQFIDFGSGSSHYINPLEMDTLEYMDSMRTFLGDKTELMCGIFSQLMDDITAQEKSLIGRCVKKVYEEVGEKKGRRKRSPTLTDYSREMGRQPEIQAHELQLALELFTDGSLDIFSHPTNVDVKNRLTVYGIADLKEEQGAVGTLIMLEGIRAKIAENAMKGKATWLYVDEFHNLARREYSAAFFEKVWKEVRKLGGICTAATQNVSDCMKSQHAMTMLENSEFLCLLNQSAGGELDLLSESMQMSDNLLDFVRDAQPGCGLLEFGGGTFIPLDARIPQDSEMYRLFNTNFHEIQKQKHQRGMSMKKEIRTFPEGVMQSIRKDPTEQERIYQP